MKFNLTIELGNDAMQTVEDLARALQKVSKKLEKFGSNNPNGLSGKIKDDNGNTVGSWCVNEEE